MTNSSYVIKAESELELPKYIDVPEYVKNKSTCYGLLFIGWSLWVWLLVPLFTLFLWGFEGSTIYQQLVLSSAPDSSISILHIASLIALSIAILFIWASYNWIRFYGNDRRKAFPALSLEKLALSFKVKKADIESMQLAKNIVLHYDEEGVLKQYDVMQIISKPV